MNERQAGVAVEGVEQHNRAEDRIRFSLLALDTHGVTNVAMAIRGSRVSALMQKSPLSVTARPPVVDGAGK